MAELSRAVLQKAAEAIHTIVEDMVNAYGVEDVIYYKITVRASSFRIVVHIQFYVHEKSDWYTTTMEPCMDGLKLSEPVSMFKGTLKHKLIELCK